MSEMKLKADESVFEEIQQSRQKAIGAIDNLYRDVAQIVQNDQTITMEEFTKILGGINTRKNKLGSILASDIERLMRKVKEVNAK